MRPSRRELGDEDPLAENARGPWSAAPKAAVRKRRQLKLMGVAELADTLDISKQRASQTAATEKEA
jgi:hypothetical protein